MNNTIITKVHSDLEAGYGEDVFKLVTTTDSISIQYNGLVMVKCTGPNNFEFPLANPKGREKHPYENMLAKEIQTRVNKFLKK